MTDYVSVVVRTNNDRWVIAPWAFCLFVVNYYGFNPKLVGKLAYLKNGVEFIYKSTEDDVKCYLSDDNVWVGGTYTDETLRNSYPHVWDEGGRFW